MELLFRSSFNRDIRKLKDRKLKDKLLALIDQLELVTELADVPNIKKLKGNREAWRVRIGDYRVGLFVNEENVLELVCFLHRKDIYKHFP